MLLRIPGECLRCFQLVTVSFLFLHGKRCSTMRKRLKVDSNQSNKATISSLQHTWTPLHFGKMFAKPSIRQWDACFTMRKRLKEVSPTKQFAPTSLHFGYYSSRTLTLFWICRYKNLFFHGTHKNSRVTLCGNLLALTTPRSHFELWKRQN